MTDTIQQTPADTATEAAVEAHLTAGPEKAAPLFSRAAVEHRRSAALAENGTDRGWRDGNDVAPLAPMPAAPTTATAEVDSAITKLNDRGGDHAALVESWGGDFGENLAYAKSAFADIVANRPDIIAKVNASGLGDEPAILALLAKHGRLSAGLMGDNTIARRNERMPLHRTGTTAFGPSGNNRGSEETRSQLSRLMRENPPGSQAYKDPHVQARIQQLNRMIAGSGSPIGIGGRTS
jgi:hypothetical protein